MPTNAPQRTHWTGCWEADGHAECAREMVRRLRDALLGIGRHACRDGTLNGLTAFNSHYAIALRLLAELELVQIVRDEGDWRVTARVVQP